MVLTSISATAKQRVLMQNVSLTSQYILSIMNELVPLYETAVKLSQGVSLLRIDTDLEDTSVCCKCSQHSKCMITVRQLIQVDGKAKRIKGTNVFGQAEYVTRTSLSHCCIEESDVR